MGEEVTPQEKKSQMKTRTINALSIGFLFGIVIWSVANNTWGLLTLIPLFFIYKLVNHSKNDEDQQK